MLRCVAEGIPISGQVPQLCLLVQSDVLREQLRVQEKPGGPRPSLPREHPQHQGLHGGQHLSLHTEHLSHAHQVGKYSISINSIYSIIHYWVWSIHWLNMNESLEPWTTFCPSKEAWEQFTQFSRLYHLAESIQRELMSVQLPPSMIIAGSPGQCRLWVIILITSSLVKIFS